MFKLSKFQAETNRLIKTGETALAEQAPGMKKGFAGFSGIVLSVVIGLTQASPTLAQCTNFKWGSAPNSNAGTRPYAIASADFNGDGKADVAVASFDNNNVTILLGNGNGTFVPPTAGFTYGLGANTRPRALVFGDFNQDTKLDIATANSGTGNVSILLGNGDGTFQLNPTTFSTGVGSTPRSMAVADLNGDNRLDLTVVTDNNNTVAILRGRNDNPATLFFQAALDVVLPSFSLSAIGIADFDQDAFLDLAIIRHQNSTPSVGRVVIVRGNGDGTFAPYSSASDYSFGASSTSSYALVVGDFNFDGYPDIAATTSGSPGSVRVLLNNANGGFPSVSGIYTAGTNPGAISSGLVLCDIDNDGKQDIVAANSGSQSVRILKGNGDGTFIVTSTPTVGAGPLSVSVVDLDGGFGSDIVVGNNTSGFNSVSVILNANSLPEVTQQPMNRQVFTNRGTSLKISATDAQSYQWRFNGDNLVNGNGITGANTAQLTIGPAAFAHAGQYDCIVGNTCGMVTSSAATLDVLQPCLGDFNHDGAFNGLDIQPMIELLLDNQECLPCK